MQMPIVREGKGWVTIPEMLVRSAAECGDAISMQMRRGKRWEKFSYRELLDIVQRLAAFLKKKGFKKGDHISVIGENRPEWCMSYLAIQWIGGVVVPLDPKLTKTELKHIIYEGDVKAVFASERFLDVIQEIADELDTLELVISMDPTNGDLNDIPAILEEVKSGIPHEDVSLDDLAVILYTSGTTGVSKGVMLTQKNIASNIDAMYQVFIFSVGDTFFSVLPIHHVFEATAGFLNPINAGSTIVFARSLKSRVLREDMTAVRPTFLLVVPLLLEKIYEGILREVRKAALPKRMLFNALLGTSRVLNPILGQKRASKALLKSVRAKLGLDKMRYIVSGGAALPRWVSKGLEDLGFPILQGYGLSETAPVLTVNPPCCPRNASVGLPLPGVQIKIIEPNIEGIGEIAAKGPNVMIGYYKNEKATKAAFTDDGWFLTGDLGYFDADGYLYITGRKKSVIVTKGGKNIYPEEVEEILLQSPFIEEVLVLMGANPHTGEPELQAIVYPNFDKLDEYFAKEGIQSPDETHIRRVIAEEIKRLSESLAPYKRPKRFSLRYEEFPKTTTRKIKRYLFEQAVTEI
ncbi:MAG: long-chain fatty acid--CoA ligase [Candidatus Hydrothermota bacterium]|nr:MAG: long-chain fatty acid--CoA ligase [Candidatus Hydrothermae bacterium]